LPPVSLPPQQVVKKRFALIIRMAQVMNCPWSSSQCPVVRKGSSLKSAAYSRAEEGRRRISLENSVARLKFSGEHDTYPTRVWPGSVTVPTAFVGAVIKCVFHNQADVKISVLRSQPDG